MGNLEDTYQGKAGGKQINVLNKQSEKSELVIDGEWKGEKNEWENERVEERAGTRDHVVKSETTSSGEKSG